MPKFYRLPDPWSYLQWGRDGCISTWPPVLGVGNGWVTANAAVLVPIIFPVAATVYSISFAAANGTGNYDIGLYGEDFGKVESSGSTAMSAAGRKTLTLTNDLRVGAGALIYGALAMSSTSGTLLAVSAGAPDAIIGGIAQQTSALPLPDPFVPATTIARRVPVFALGIR